MVLTMKSRLVFWVLMGWVYSAAGCTAGKDVSEPIPSDGAEASVEPGNDSLDSNSNAEPCEPVAETESSAEPEPDSAGDEQEPATCDLEYEVVKRQKVSQFYRWPHRTCVEEADGDTFCFWESVRAAVPLGKSFIEYGNCQVLSTQAPPWQTAVRPMDCDDPRLEDPDWVAESDWVRHQLRSTACACCHDSSQTGYADSFDIHAGAGWVSQLTEMGILTFGGFKAVLSGRDKDRKAFIPPEENNGFSRDEGRLGFQTTDVDRLRAFFQRELDWRNITNDDIEAFPTIPIPEQLNMEQAVEPCPQGSGIDANGVVHWVGSQESRYIYVRLQAQILKIVVLDF